MGLLGDLFPLRTPDPYFANVYQPVIVGTVRASRALTHLLGVYRAEGCSSRLALSSCQRYQKMRLTVCACALVLLLAGPCHAQVESWLPFLRPDPYFDFMYYPIITVFMRATEVIQNVSGGAII
ncbi:hypothetical protein FJT64_015622 [Amphibalanus amphitrite]|uniref:Uncharacterized protein n=1 Tax=Amphibalanus amphitrite TaxID=1232801 RepID=A0A6A4X8Q7_AMPAM|nr:hypothetical protein FJT64_015622 [Amphibalanus amphitrite]